MSLRGGQTVVFWAVRRECGSENQGAVELLLPSFPLGLLHMGGCFSGAPHTLQCVATSGCATDRLLWVASRDWPLVDRDGGSFSGSPQQEGGVGESRSPCLKRSVSVHSSVLIYMTVGSLFQLVFFFFKFQICVREQIPKSIGVFTRHERHEPNCFQ